MLVVVRSVLVIVVRRFVIMSRERYWGDSDEKCFGDSGERDYDDNSMYEMLNNCNTAFLLTISISGVLLPASPSSLLYFDEQWSDENLCVFLVNNSFLIIVLVDRLINPSVGFLVDRPKWLR